MVLEGRVIYKYPDIAIKICKGVSPSTKKGWQFASPKGRSFKCRSNDFDSMKSTLVKNGFQVPDDFGEISTFHIKGLFLSPNSLTIRPTVPYKRSAETFTFQFDKESMGSFSSAIESAIRCRQCIVKMGKECERLQLLLEKKR